MVHKSDTYHSSTGGRKTYMKIRSYSVYLYALLVLAYTFLGLLIPLSRETREAYNFSLSQAHIIAFITALPLFGVWFMAFFGYGKLQKYVSSIRKSKEEGAFAKIADGVMILSWGLVVQAFTALIFTGIADHITSFSTAAVILQNYISLAFPLVAFSLIANGARKLVTARHNYASLPNSRLLILLFAFIASVYSYLILHLRDQQGNAADHLPIILLLCTVIIPYLYAWFSGLIAAFDISMHARTTSGLLYKRSLGRLSAGLIVLIVASILMQYLNSVFISHVGDFSLNVVLLIDYLLLLGISHGYLLIINGVNGLQKIEEI